MAEDLTDGLVELNYRQLHGKLFASLLALFGSSKTSTIEDAIQNAFYKSLKSWRSGQIPKTHLIGYLLFAKMMSCVNWENNKKNGRSLNRPYYGVKI